MSIFDECKVALSDDISILNDEQADQVLILLSYFLNRYGLIDCSKIKCIDYPNLEDLLSKVVICNSPAYVVADDISIPVFKTNFKLVFEHFYDIAALGSKVYIFNEHEIFSPIFPNDCIRHGVKNFNRGGRFEKPGVDGLQDIKDDMTKFLKSDKRDTMDIYENDIEMQIVRAGRLGDTDFLKKMIEEGQFDPLKVTPSEQWNRLHRANTINPSPVSTVLFYLNKGVPVNAQDCYGMTPLHYAMRSENADAALVLLQAGADPNIPNQDGVIPLSMIGGMPERLDVLQLMLDKGGNVHHFTAQNDTDILDTLKLYLGEDDIFKPVIMLMEKYA